MKLKDYLWFWKTSWSYMRGARLEFWIRIIPVTYRYRRQFILDKKNGYKYKGNK